MPSFQSREIYESDTAAERDSERVLQHRCKYEMELVREQRGYRVDNRNSNNQIVRSIEEHSQNRVCQTRSIDAERERTELQIEWSACNARAGIQ